MNNELEELEFELSRLRPRAPSEFLEVRVESALENRGSAGRAMLRGFAAAGFAAVVAWMAALSPDAAVPGGAALRPVVAEETLQSAQDEGLMTLDDGSLAQRLRLRYVETLCWSGGGRTLTWTAPREELRILPVATY
ncbi:MAG: hypothetical protein QM760_06325 [Nibricoccus sp.]